MALPQSVNTLRSRQNGHQFADNTFKRIFLSENIRISMKISLKFIPKGPIDNIPVLVQIMAWRQPGDKPLSEPMMVSLLTHICITRPKWVDKVSLNCVMHTIMFLITGPLHSQTIPDLQLLRIKAHSCGKGWNGLHDSHNCCNKCCQDSYCCFNKSKQYKNFKPLI